VLFRRTETNNKQKTLEKVVSIRPSKYTRGYSTTNFEKIPFDCEWDLWREWDLNPRPSDYEPLALPLSYLARAGCILYRSGVFVNKIANFE
jgi:hypothetical protein